MMWIIYRKILIMLQHVVLSLFSMAIKKCTWTQNGMDSFMPRIAKLLWGKLPRLKKFMVRFLEERS